MLSMLIGIFLLVLHIVSIYWSLVILGGGIGEHAGVGPVLSWRNIGLTVAASALLVALDRYYANAQSEIATWRLIPLFYTGGILVVASVFTVPKDWKPSIVLKIVPRVIGVLNFLIFLQLSLNILRL
jgi:hypothetical protein